MFYQGKKSLQFGDGAKNYFNNTVMWYNTSFDGAMFLRFSHNFLIKNKFLTKNSKSNQK